MKDSTETNLASVQFPVDFVIEKATKMIDAIKTDRMELQEKYERAKQFEITQSKKSWFRRKYRNLPNEEYFQKFFSENWRGDGVLKSAEAMRAVASARTIYGTQLGHCKRILALAQNAKTLNIQTIMLTEEGLDNICH